MVFIIVDCEYNIYEDTVRLEVDYYPEGKTDSREVFVFTTQKAIVANEDMLHAYIERQVKLHRKKVVDWTGHTWTVKSPDVFAGALQRLVT